MHVFVLYNDVNVCGSAHCGCVVNGNVAMAALYYYYSEKAKLLDTLSNSEVEKKSALNQVQELEARLVQVQEECDRKITSAARQREGEGRHERDEEVEALRRRVDELTGAAAQIMRLESMVRDQWQTLRSKESETQSLIEEI